MFHNEQQDVEAKIRRFCAQNQLPELAEFKWSPLPFAGEWGISTSFFQLAADEARQAGKRLSVSQRAQEIGDKAVAYLQAEFSKSTAGGKPASYQRLEAANGYLNLYFSTPEFSRRVIDTVLSEGERFGYGSQGGERIMVEYSQPNTHKAFHVGHLRNTILGSAISNILEAAGNTVIRANYFGDIGLHVIKWLWNYQKYHAGEQPGEDKIRWMNDLYTEAGRRLEENPELEAEVRELFARWDQRAPDVVALWEKTRQWSIEGFNQAYALLGARFDHIYYESEVENSGKVLVDALIRRGIAIDERPEGPVIVRLDDLLGLKKEKYRVLVILRSDGTSLYATKDIPLAINKFEQYNLDRSIYVIDVRQSLYLQQIFKTMEIMGYAWADRCYHLGYELVNLPGNVTMSSREGTVVLLEDLIREATQRALAIVREKNPSLAPEVMESVAQAVALGAIKYPMLARENTRMVTFDWQSALDFNGQAAPYIQYAHVRANSILRRLETPIPDSLTPSHPLDATEVQLIDWISRLPGEVQRAAAEYKPLHLTNLAYELASSFNDFYAKCPVLKAEPGIRNFRLRLVAAARQSIANTLMILGIPYPEVM